MGGEMRRRREGRLRDAEGREGKAPIAREGLKNRNFSG